MQVVLSRSATVYRNMLKGLLLLNKTLTDTLTTD